MKKISILFVLLFSTLFANADSKPKVTEEHFREDTREERDRYRDDRRSNRELTREVRRLREDVARLESMIADLMAMMDSRDNHTRRPIIVSPREDWTCYMKDMKVGGIYASGRSEGEARGKALMQCTDKDGVCFEHNLKCSKAE